MKYFILMALFYKLLLPNPITLAKGLQNQDISLYYYYWKNKNGEYYLGKKRNDGKYSVWIYTKERKWKPFHNANAFDGFPKAGKMYDSVSFENGNIRLEVSNESNNSDGDNNESPPTTPPLPFNSDVLALETKTFKVDYYFWLNKDGMAFLSKTRDTDKTSIWHYTIERKWMPIYNAEAFDGFSAIGDTFDSAKIDIALSKINIGKFTNHLQEDFNLRLSSDSLGDKNSLTSHFFMMTPQFSWTYDEKYKTINESFILQLTKKDGTLVYSTLLSKDSNNTEEGRGKSGIIISLPLNSFCEKEYTNINNSNNAQIDYTASIYAVYDTGITNKPTCTKDIMDKENYLAKASLNMAIISDSTVKSKSAVVYNKDEKYIEGNIEFKFRDVSLKESIEDLKNYMNITNLPKDFSVAKDLEMSHKIIDKNTLMITIQKSNASLDNKVINIEFLDTLFSEMPQKSQKAIVYIKDYQRSTDLPLP